MLCKKVVRDLGDGEWNVAVDGCLFLNNSLDTYSPYRGAVINQLIQGSDLT